MPEDIPSPHARQASAGPPRANTTALLGLAYMALGHRIVQGVVSAGFPQRPAHSAVFAHIDVDGGTRLTTLAQRASITPQAIGELVDDLERMGYVQRRPDPGDRRAKLIVLTERGKSAVAAAQRIIADLEAGLANLLGPDGLAGLHEMLERIADSAQGTAERL
ncbi:MAG: MarR family transcriptional regulator [Chloroflexota bacterium]|nr:MarR family transcriptional regulator [Chloroflexota bacterium]